ncbi:hypothetical protein B0H11DRAFT_2221667 [Mycena galericulata]|nr:hypothetical protein B0H11DRAFT_2221667 [Mycena galericulata]
MSIVLCLLLGCSAREMQRHAFEPEPSWISQTPRTSRIASDAITSIEAERARITILLPLLRIPSSNRARRPTLRCSAPTLGRRPVGSFLRAANRQPASLTRVLSRLSAYRALLRRGVSNSTGLSPLEAALQRHLTGLVEDVKSKLLLPCAADGGDSAAIVRTKEFERKLLAYIPREQVHDECFARLLQPLTR